MNGQPPMPTHENVPGAPPTTRLTAALKAAVTYGPMHLCRFGDCEVWVADGGDHRCVLHSEEPWAREARHDWLSDKGYLPPRQTPRR